MGSLGLDEGVNILQKKWREAMAFRVSEAGAKFILLASHTTVVAAGLRGLVLT